MLRLSWKAYQEVNYQHPRMNEPVLCLLLEIDFDEESVYLQPMWGNNNYIKKDFIANIKHCSIPKRKMKAAYIEGKKVKDGLPLYEGSSKHHNPYFKLDDENKPVS